MRACATADLQYFPNAYEMPGKNGQDRSLVVFAGL
jgi:hypothetical protein